MSDASPAQPATARRLEIWLPAVIVVADQITKYLVRRSLPIHDSVEVLPGFLDFTHVRNTGAAFGMLNTVDFPFKTLVIAIVAMGATAGKYMAKTADPISKFRGRFASWDGIPVMPTYHPAYLLRNPSAKKTVWEDLKLVMDILGPRPE